MSDPLAYFLTWHTYGTWLPGHERGSVDDEHRAFDTPFAPHDRERIQQATNRLVHPPIELDQSRRGAVQAAVAEVGAFRQWPLLAIHVRTTHAHAVVIAPVKPEKVLGDFKAYATRRLRREGLVGAADRTWAVHGSTRYVWKTDHLINVIDYVVNRQGAPLLPAPLDQRHLLGL